MQKELTFNQPNVARAGPLRELFGAEFDPLSFTEQLEHRTSHRAAVKEVFDARLIPNEPEAFIDQQSCDRARRHFRVLRSTELPEAVPGVATLRMGIKRNEAVVSRVASVRLEARSVGGSFTGSQVYGRRRPSVYSDL